MVRSDKVIKPEDYVNYPEGYHVQSYVSKGKEYPSLDDIVKKESQVVIKLRIDY